MGALVGVKRAVHLLALFAVCCLVGVLYVLTEEVDRT